MNKKNIEIEIFPYDSPEKINSDVLESFDFQSPNQYIQLKSDDLSSRNPLDGMTERGSLTIEYYPESKKCIDLKSLMYYIEGFRNIGIKQLDLTDRIHCDLHSFLGTSKLKITTTYKLLSGFTSTCTRGDC